MCLLLGSVCEQAGDCLDPGLPPGCIFALDERRLWQWFPWVDNREQSHLHRSCNHIVTVLSLDAVPEKAGHCHDPGLPPGCIFTLDEWGLWRWVPGVGNSRSSDPAKPPEQSPQLPRKMPFPSGHIPGTGSLDQRCLCCLLCELEWRAGLISESLGQTRRQVSPADAPLLDLLQCPLRCAICTSISKNN